VSVPVEPIYLVIRDAALRSSLTAWLGLTGHAIVALQDLASLASSRPVATGLFVIEHDVLPANRGQWMGTLEPLVPPARCIILVAGEAGMHGPLTLADRRSALSVIQMMIARLEGRQADG
jgi:hypothetical protein